MIYLKNRPEKERQGIFAQASVLSSLYHPNNFQALIAFRSRNILHQEAQADRILARPIFLCHRLINDGDSRRVGTIFCSELTTSQERNSHRPEVTWANLV